MTQPRRSIVTSSARELTNVLRLSETDANVILVRSEINRKIVDAVKEKGLTHQEVAKLAGTSRTRVTALLNFNSSSVSTDLMLRILGALGYRAKVTFSRAA